MPAGNHVIYAETILSSSYLWRLHWLTIVSETCPSIKKKSHFSKREEKKGWWDRSVITCSLIPCGLVARIRRSHRRGRGSIPRTGVCLRKISKNAKCTRGFVITCSTLVLDLQSFIRHRKVFKLIKRLFKTAYPMFRPTFICQAQKSPSLVV